MESVHVDGGIVERLPLHDARDGFVFDLHVCEYVMADARWVEVELAGMKSRVEYSKQQRRVQKMRGATASVQRWICVPPCLPDCLAGRYT